MKNIKKIFSASILIILILVLSAANIVHAFEITATILVNTGGTMAYDSGKAEIWMPIFVPFVNEMGMHVSMSNSVSAISDKTNAVVATAQVGEGPSSIAYDSGKEEIFVASYNLDTISVISSSTNKVVATVALENHSNGPWDLVYDSGKGEIFVQNYFTGVISIISDKSNTVVATVSLGTNPGPSGLVYDSGKGEIFVSYDNVNYNGSNDSSNFVSVISDSNNSVVATVPLGNNAYPSSLAYDSGKGEIFIVNDGNNSVEVISDRTNAVVATVPVGNQPADVAYVSGKGEIFVTNFKDNTILIISDSTNTVTATVPAGSTPSSLVYDPDKGEIFIVNSGPSISVLSDSSLLSVSPSPTAPEFTAPALILLFAVVGAVTVYAVALPAKRTRD